MDNFVRTVNEWKFHIVYFWSIIFMSHHSTHIQHILSALNITNVFSSHQFTELCTSHSPPSPPLLHEQPITSPSPSVSGNTSWITLQFIGCVAVAGSLISVMSIVRWSKPFVLTEDICGWLMWLSVSSQKQEMIKASLKILVSPSNWHPGIMETAFTPVSNCS